MPVVAYVDPDSVHNPAANVAPATWFTTIEADFRSIIGRVGASISASTTQDVTQPGPTKITLGNTDWNNGMTIASSEITVPASYAGKYLVSVGIRLESTTAGPNFVLVAATVNGATVQQEYARRVGASGSAQASAFSFTYALTVGDDLALFAQTSAANPTDLDTLVTISQPYIAAVWLSP